MAGSQKTDRERIDRLERAVAEHTDWHKGNWQGAAAERSAAGQILHERRAAEREAADRAAALRAEIQAEVEARLREAV